MRYRINQLRLKINDIDNMNDEAAKLRKLEEAIKCRFRNKKFEISNMTLIKESVDARRKPDIRLVYTVDFSSSAKLPLDRAPDMTYSFPAVEKKAKRPVIAGFGPCGIFAALVLAEAGQSPIVIERGACIDDRIKDVERFWNEGILDTESNVQFGEGGAGTFSDGKLTTGIKDIRIRKVLEEFVRAGAPENILYSHKPHIGTDRLRTVVKNLRCRIEELGGEVLFRTRLSDIDLAADSSGKLRLKGIYAEDTGAGICTDGHSVTKYIAADQLILAVGHSARDTFEMLYSRKMLFEQKPFSIGVRIEHPQRVIDRAQYGDERIADKIGAADYKLNYRCANGRGVYTFCMCPGGFVINASSEKNTAVTNGMSNAGRNSGTSNSGLLVDVKTSDFDSDHPLAGIAFQRKYEHKAFVSGRGKLPTATLGEFVKKSDNCVRQSLPEFAAESIIEAMPFLGKKLKGFDDDAAVLTAVETRSSSPVRILRDELHCSNIAGIYPAGEGPGYAGGIVSAAVDGIKTAEKTVNERITAE